jgi:hypothetical protein
MALADLDLFNSRDFAGSIRMVVKENKVATFASNAGATVMVPGLPVALNSSSKLWVPYTQPSDAAVFTITNQSSDVDGGSQEIYIDGLTVPLVAWNVTAAALQTAINAVLADAGKPYTVACACSEANLGVAAAVMTVTFSENAGAPSIAYNGAGITDGGVSEPHVMAVSDAGTALNDTNVIRGFIAHDSVTLDAAGEVQGVIMLAGQIHRDDVNTAAMRALLEGSPSEAELDVALRALSMRDQAMYVQGLADVA